jgi:hypothetical protein
MRRYIQQYGKERTGTNYLKALLGRNFTDFVLFDNRLGSKHEPYRTAEQWMRERGVVDRQAFERLLQEDEYWRTRNVPTSDPFEWVHQPVSYEELLALCNGSATLHYVINIKDPYAYAVSVNRWNRSGLRRFHQPPSTDPLDLSLVTSQCALFNCAYRSYRRLIEDGRAVLARYEDLLADCRPVLREIQERFHLEPAGSQLQDISETVAPSIGISQSPFYKSYYVTREYMRALPVAARQAIRGAIDWDLMSDYGYLPE